MSGPLRNLALATTALLPLGIGQALAGPQAPSVVGGSATISNPGTANVTIQQTTPSAIINWKTFNIGAGETTTFVQPNASSVALNRVTGGEGPSQILGSLNANGKVFIVNRDGIFFGPNATVNTSGFLATTSDIKNSDFMAGKYNFNIPGRPDASIVNKGTITAHNAGFAALVAPGVRNDGTITATLGTVGLASGNGFTLDLYGDKLITLAVGDSIANQVVDVQSGKPLNALVENAGRIKANGGRVELTAAAARHVVDSVINNKGVIEANRIGKHGGTIVLSAATASSKGAGAPTQTVKLAGTISAAARKKGHGGKVIVTGEDVQVASATVNVSGPKGGGTVLIGGDWGGGHPDTSVTHDKAKLEKDAVPTAATVTIDSGSTINASATQNGNGGKVVVWSDERTSSAGTILATGAGTGRGGFIETSGKTINVTGTITAGPGGLWLLDPGNLVINAPQAATIVASLNGGSDVLQQTVQAGNSQESGDIFVHSSIIWSGAGSLTLSAFHDILVLNSTIQSNGSGNVTLRADNTGRGNGSVFFDGGHLSANTGKISIFYNPQSREEEDNKYDHPRNFSGNVTVPSPSQFTPYMLVNSANDLSLLGKNKNTLSQTYALGRDFSAKGFNGFPTGTTFAGVLDGNGGLGTNYTISNLTLSSAQSQNSYGLFPFIGPTGIVRNLDLASVNISAGANIQFIGALAGENRGTISNVRVLSGSVNGGSFENIGAGGLVGQNSGTIRLSSVEAKVSVSVSSSSTSAQRNFAGGLVGSNLGTIDQSHASAAVSGGNNSDVGGLVGQNGLMGQASAFGTITNSFATGAVSVTSGSDNSSSAGGLVGANNNGSIANSYATGAVSGSGVQIFAATALGGLVGMNQNGSTISNSYATGAVTGGDNTEVGGLVGSNNASIVNSYATGAVTGGNGSSAGGLIGFQGIDGTTTNSYATGNVAGVTNAGGLVGDNAGAITGSYATGAVSVSSTTATDMAAGGLVGNNSGTIANSHATGNVSSSGGDVGLGGLVGFNGDLGGSITNSYATGNVTASGAFSALIGGLVGGNGGTIVNAQASGTVSTDASVGFVGGFVGLNVGDISGSTASGNVQLASGTSAIAGGTFAIAGGFVGGNLGSITTSSASGNVNGGDGTFLGGFAGWNFALVSESFATGAVTGGANSFVGGFAGLNFGTIEQSFAGGAVKGGDNSAVGGLVALNVGIPDFSLGAAAASVPAAGPVIGAGSIVNAFATGAVTGGANSTVGALVALNGGTIDHTWATGFVTAGPGSTTGGLVAVGSAAFDPFANPLIGSAAAGAIDPPGTVTNSFWDPGLTGQSTSPGGGIPLPDPTNPLGLFTNTPWLVQTATFPCLSGLPCNVPALTSVLPDVVPPPDVIPPLPPDVIPPLPPIVIPPLPPTIIPPLPPIDVQLTPPLNNQVPSPSLVQAVVNNLLPPPSNIQLATVTTVDPQPSTPAAVVTPPSETTTATSQNQPGNQQGNNGSNGSSGSNGSNGLRPDGRPSNIPPLTETRFINNQVVFQICNPAVPAARIQAAMRRLRLSVLSQQSISILGCTVYQTQIAAGGLSVRAVMQQLEKDRLIDMVSPNYMFELAQDAGNPAAAPAASEGDPAQYIIGKLKLADVHRIATGQDVRIAVIDSEIDGKHPDLEGAIAGRYEPGGSAEKPHPHGTGMAGAIASHRKLMGVAPGARLLAIRAFGGASSGAQGTTVQIVQGLDWAIGQGAKVINMSFAGPKDPTLQKAFKAAYDRHVVLIAAAGNAGPKSPPLYPGADPNVIAVSAVDADGNVYTNANRGKYVAVAAPGVEILVPAPDGNYELTTGTSVAAAHVSGVAALLLQRDPTLDPSQIRQILTSTANNGGKGRSDELGYGVVDPLRALNSLNAKSASAPLPETQAARN